jgi:hypothetical protein
MNNKEFMILSHCKTLSSIFGDKLKNLNFNTYVSNNLVDKDTVFSDCSSRKLAIITRHHLDFTYEATHTVILEKEAYGRLR